MSGYRFTCGFVIAAGPGECDAHHTAIFPSLKRTRIKRDTGLPAVLALPRLGLRSPWDYANVAAMSGSCTNVIQAPRRPGTPDAAPTAPPAAIPGPCQPSQIGGPTMPRGVNPHQPQQPAPEDPGPGPKSASLTPAMVALSFTTIVIQVQAVFHGNARDLLPILIAALLAMTGVARSLGSRPGLARRSHPAPSCAPTSGGRASAPGTRTPCCPACAGQAVRRASGFSARPATGVYCRPPASGVTVRGYAAAPGAP